MGKYFTSVKVDNYASVLLKSSFYSLHNGTPAFSISSTWQGRIENLYFQHIENAILAVEDSDDDSVVFNVIRVSVDMAWNNRPIHPYAILFPEFSLPYFNQNEHHLPLSVTPSISRLFLQPICPSASDTNYFSSLARILFNTFSLFLHLLLSLCLSL